MKRRTLAVLAVVAALEFTAAAHGEAYARGELNKVHDKADYYLDRGVAAALAFDWIEACKWYALATAFGGTEFYKRYYDGVVLILSKKERKSCLETVHAESVQQRESHLKAEQMASYRTDTLNRLRQVLGDRPDISILGHRFVFRPEVLFATGEAEVLQGGLAQLKHLATTLPDLIPQDVDCSLLVTSADHSKALGLARVAAVTESLIEQGFTRCRLTTYPHSPNPLSPNRIGPNPLSPVGDIAFALKLTPRDPS